MAAGAVDACELRELIVELVTAVQGLPGEPCSVPIEVPLSDDVELLLREREALVATMAALPEKERAKARTVFARELETAEAPRRGTEYWPQVPGEEDPGGVFERLRRARLLDIELDHALSGVLGPM